MVRVKRSLPALELTKKCFGFLKGRFRRLSDKMDFEDINFMCQCIQTACVLHNICVKYNDECKFFINDSDSMDLNSEDWTEY